SESVTHRHPQLTTLQLAKVHRSGARANPDMAAAIADLSAQAVAFHPIHLHREVAVDAAAARRNVHIRVHRAGQGPRHAARSGARVERLHGRGEADANAAASRAEAHAGGASVVHANAARSRADIEVVGGETGARHAARTR